MSSEAELLETFKNVKEDNTKVSDRMTFLRDSEKMSSEEALDIERKLLVANQ